MKPADDPHWIEGPPQERGCYWIVWRSAGGPRVVAVDLSPAVIRHNDPTAPLLLKTMGGLAYQLAPNIHHITHHMPLVAPPPPAIVSEERKP